MLAARWLWQESRWALLPRPHGTTRGLALPSHRSPPAVNARIYPSPISATLSAAQPFPLLINP